MAISTDTLFHFTEKKESLIGILENNFKIFYCKETLILGGNIHTIRVPMVSFCDIPLSQAKDHISKYGRYCIGMTKEWGLRKGLNPVLYLAQKSTISASYRFALQQYAEDPINEWNESQKSLCDVLRYMKNYEADLYRKSTLIKNSYRFSDEREWRFVPPHSSSCTMLIPYHNDEEDSANCDDQLSDMRLSFEPNDIKYIIIDDENEIIDFINYLRSIKGKKYLYHDVEKLITRIFTTEQIMKDL